MGQREYGQEIQGNDAELKQALMSLSGFSKAELALLELHIQEPWVKNRLLGILQIKRHEIDGMLEDAAHSPETIEAEQLKKDLEAIVETEAYSFAQDALFLSPHQREILLMALADRKTYSDIWMAVIEMFARLHKSYNKTSYSSELAAPLIALIDKIQAADLPYYPRK